MPLTATILQSQADAWKAAFTSNTAYVAVHTGDPGAAGTSAEATGGSPAYARKASTLTSGSGGVVNGAQVTIDLPAGTYTHVSYWTAASGGTFLGRQPMAPNITLSAQGTVVITPGLVQS